MSLAELITEMPDPKLKAAKAAADEEVILDITIPEQKFDNWCWAAVTAGIEQAYGGSSREQCQIVSDVLGKVCCPAESASSECNRTQSMDAPLGEHLRRKFDDPSHRTFEFVRTRIRGGFPIAVRIDWNEGGAGHVVVITGYRRTEKLLELWVSDPETGERSKVRFEHFVSFYQQRGFWDISYETKSPQDVRRVPKLLPASA